MHAVLAADDHEDTLELIHMALGHRFDVTTALGGEAALDALRKRPFDCFIVDLFMPDLDGATIVAHARIFFPSVPIVVVSASVSMASQIEGLGVEAALKKPIDPIELVDVIERVCSQGRSAKP